MRCPKCHYLSFEPEPRCRNCGYDLSFDTGEILVKKTAEQEDREEKEDARANFDLRMKPSEVVASVPTPMEPMAFEDLQDFHGPDVTATIPEPTPMPAPIPARAPVPVVKTSEPTSELPLFLRGIPDTASESPFDAPLVQVSPPEPTESEEPLEPEEPLVKVPRTPRVPLSVRRNTPAPGRVRERYQAAVDNRQIGLLERDLLNLQDEPVEVQEPVWGPVTELPAVEPDATLAFESSEENAGAMQRLEAAGVDLLFIGSINIGIVWLTLQRLELTFAQIGLLPILPLAALFLLLDALYLLMFTATNGQTIGKMVAGIRVVGTSTDAVIDRVTLKQALLRAALTFPSVLALGAGFVPALVGQGLALHDRFAHTRVVRA